MNKIDELHESLDIISKLEDNWDGYGACALDNQTAMNVKLLINLINSDYLELCDDLTPSPYGTISLQFTDRTGNELNIEVGKSLIGMCGDIDGKMIAQDDIDCNDLCDVMDHVYSLKVNI
jgi:hypothetical protein